MLGISLLIIVLASIGHLVVVRALLDRVYTKGLSKHLWHGLFALHVAAMIAGPVLLVRFVGQKGPAVLRGGTWSDAHPAWIAYSAACVAALLSGIIVLLWRNRQAAPAAQQSNHTVTHDVARELGHIPAQRDLRGCVARLAGNEVFHLDVTERQIVVPRLAASLDGLSILHLSDSHLNGTPDREYFQWAVERCIALKPDIVAHTGDIIDHPGVADWLPSTLGRLVNHVPLGCFFVLGNHDLQTTPDDIRAAMENIGWRWLGGNAAQLQWNSGAIRVAGTEQPWSRRSPTLDTTAESSFVVLLSHSPHEVKVARQHGVDLVLAGHLHGGQIRAPLFGPLSGGRFASGLFDLPPTLLHVSRGIGQMAPLRWGCRPEVTKLVLRARRRETA